MDTFSFEKLTVYTVSHSYPTDNKDPVVSSGKSSHLFASSDKYGILSDAWCVDCIVSPFRKGTFVLFLIGVLFVHNLFWVM